TRKELSPTMLKENIKVLAPLDIESKGTWIGVNEHGLLLSLSNAYQPDRESYLSNDSRGKLVLDTLKKCKDSEEAKSFICKRINEQKFKFFNLFCISPKKGFFIKYNGAFNSFVLPNSTTLFHYSSGYDNGKVKEIRELRLKQLFKDSNPETISKSLKRIKQACCDHFKENIPSDNSICMHGSPRRTISSTIFVIGNKLQEYFCEYLNGYPCEQKYKKFFFKKYKQNFVGVK
ncbi:MAG TPA: NRDE family protein, partial [Candidatus Nanoarchaeia archaeon]|nr:NRDE family protein [Candidatus Nanoarchaeia archaeon]